MWEPNHRYVIDVDVSTYPRSLRWMFAAFRGTWSLQPRAAGIEVTLGFDAQLRRIPGIKLVAGVRARKAGAEIDAILAAYAGAVAAGRPTARVP